MVINVHITNVLIINENNNMTDSNMIHENS